MGVPIILYFILITSNTIDCILVAINGISNISNIVSIQPFLDRRVYFYLIEFLSIMVGKVLAIVSDIVNENDV